MDNGRARESGPRFAGPDEFRDNDVVVGSPNLIFENRMSEGGIPKGTSPFCFFLVELFDSMLTVDAFLVSRQNAKRQ